MFMNKFSVFQITSRLLTMKLPSNMKHVKVLLAIGIVLLLINLMSPNYWLLAAKDGLFALASLGALVNIVRMNGPMKQKLKSRSVLISTVLWIVLLVLSSLSLYARTSSYKLHHEYTVKIVQILAAVSAYSVIVLEGKIAGV